MLITRVLQRETGCVERGRSIMIEIHPREIVLRLKGTRQKFALSYAGLYWTAAKQAAERRRAEAAARKRR